MVAHILKKKLFIVISLSDVLEFSLLRGNDLEPSVYNDVTKGQTQTRGKNVEEVILVFNNKVRKIIYGKQSQNYASNAKKQIHK